MALIYTSGSIPLFQNDEVNELARYVEEELSRLEQVLRNYEVETMRFSILNNAIDKPRNGDVIYADGTNWNPGSGAGLYEYKGGAWSKL